MSSISHNTSLPPTTWVTEAKGEPSSTDRRVTFSSSFSPSSHFPRPRSSYIDEFHGTSGHLATLYGLGLS